MQPRDPAWERKVRESFSRQQVMATFGATLAALEPGRCELHLPFREELTQQHGFLHAGVMGTIVDSAGGYAGFSLFAPDTSVMAVEFKLNFLAPGDGELFVGVGEVVRSGRTLTICRLEGYVEKAGKRTHCVTGTQTLMAVAGRAER